MRRSASSGSFGRWNGRHNRGMSVAGTTRALLEAICAKWRTGAHTSATGYDDAQQRIRNAEGAWYATGCPDIEPRSDPERDAALRVVRAAKRAMVVLSGVERIESGAVDAFVVAVAEFEREETKGWPVPGAKPVGPSRSYGG